MSISREQALALDAADDLAFCRTRFMLPEGKIYLDGNSLGPLPLGVADELAKVVAQEWGNSLIASWNQHGWIDLPRQVGEKIAPLLGAAPGQVIAADSTSVNLFKLLSAGLQMHPQRRLVLSTSNNFPTDLYVAEGLSRLLGESACRLELVEPDALLQRLDDDVALVMLTHVDFRSGRLWDLAEVTRAVHDVGAIVLWDLAHSAGAVPLALDDAEVDLAVGCGYKYLNGGPGAPAFVYVAQRHHSALQQPLSGWMGHADPFAFSSSYTPAAGIGRMLCGTPSVLALRALDRALDVWRDLDMQQVRQKSLALSQLLIELVAGSAGLSQFKLCSPADPARRGSQVSFSHPDAYAVSQALIAADVIGDFREPDLLRFGLTPLYLRFVDVWDAISRLDDIVRQRRFDAPQFRQRSKVT